MTHHQSAQYPWLVEFVTEFGHKIVSAEAFETQSDAAKYARILNLMGTATRVYRVAA